MKQVEALFDAIESKSKIMFQEHEESKRLEYLVDVYKTKIREVFHELHSVRQELKDCQLDLIAKEK